MSDQGHRVKLTFIKTLLRTTRLSGEALTEAMSDYMEMDDASLDNSIEFLGQFSFPVCPGEGTSSQPHTGVETSSHADQTIAHRQSSRLIKTPIPGTSHHKSQRLTPNVPPSTQLTPDSQASGRQSRRHHRRQSSTPQADRLLGAGIALKRRMGDLCSSYLKQVHIPWDDQHEDDKKYVINTLERSMGHDGVTSGWSSKCANSWVIDATQHGAIVWCRQTRQRQPFAWKHGNSSARRCAYALIFPNKRRQQERE
ncbi:hypothetical protein GOP47_0002566 [Adiantum capillus-veneris]|uniref:Uncharacterized protein n=1 Tax=Adiantum capillus-veneris TaxID=13818 RepID=A0A9D4ZP84_ADICA|nr:hypothetical protein GOP47_0002566 [Adiantum capillus-veneris]